MELDELKIRLQAKLQDGIQLQNRSSLEASIRTAASAATAQIKKNIWFEAAACVVCTVIAIIICAVYKPFYIRFFAVAGILFGLVFCAYLFTLYKKIAFYEKGVSSLSNSLVQAIDIITRFIRLYFRISIGLLPVIYIFGLITGYLDVSQKGLLQQFQWSTGFILYTAIFGTWSVIMWLFARWYIRKLYGSYLKQLQQQLKDLQNG